MDSQKVERSDAETSIWTNKQIDDLMDRERQTERQMDNRQFNFKHNNQETERLANLHWQKGSECRLEGRWRSRGKHSHRQAGRQAGRQADTLACMLASWHAGTLAGWHW
jgi:hypothetical protein